MSVKKKQMVHKIDEKLIENAINKGAKTKVESSQGEDEENILFTLRIPRSLMDKIDEMRKKKVGKVSKNQFILETLYEKVK